MWMWGRGGTLRAQYLQGDVHVLPGGGGPSGTVMGMLKKKGITVDGELACPAAPHSKCVLTGTCLGTCLGEGH